MSTELLTSALWKELHHEKEKTKKPTTDSKAKTHRRSSINQSSLIDQSILIKTIFKISTDLRAGRGTRRFGPAPVWSQYILQVLIPRLQLCTTQRPHTGGVRLCTTQRSHTGGVRRGQVKPLGSHLCHSVAQIVFHSHTLVHTGPGLVVAKGGAGFKIMSRQEGLVLEWWNNYLI